VLVGKHIKKWRGHFYIYQRLPDGCEVRRFRNIYLGLKSEMDKREARTMLRDIIARETRNVAPAPVTVTLRWFYENRFLPQKEEQWKVTSRPKTKRFIENYLLKRFGDTLLADLGKFTLQTYLNELAPNFSKSVLTKTRGTLIPSSTRRWSWNFSSRTLRASSPSPGPARRPRAFRSRRSRFPRCFFT